VILMENHGYGDIYGTATFMTQHADANASLQNYSAIDHPSEPNYLSLFCGLAGDCNNGGGATGGCMTGGGDSTSDCSSQPGGACSMGATHNLVDLLEGAGLTWQAWNENAAMPCDISAGNVRHVPFLYFDDITNNATRCSRVTTSTPGTDQELVAALGSTTTASNFMWLTPDDDHDMHNNSVASGDAYLGVLVPQILGSQVFKTQKAALFIVFDEGSGSATYPNDLLYAVWAGPAVKTSFVSSAAYSHYSFLATIEANWGLPSLTANDQAAAPMTEAFK
jgi:acid phosphatase